MPDPAEFGAGLPAEDPLSEVLIDFAQPALAAVPPEASVRMRRLMLTLAVRVWNESVAEARGTRQDVLDAITKDLNAVPDAGRQHFVHMASHLYHRKRAHFAPDLRFVGHWTLDPNDTGFVFKCETERGL